MLPQNLKYFFRGNSSFERLIASVVIATAIIWVFYFLALLFDLPTGHWWRYFALPGSWQIFIKQPWSLVTYAWIHTGLIGFFINLLLLYYLGNIFLTYEDEKKMMSLFAVGILTGAMAFLLSIKYLPFFYKDETNVYLTGISAGYMIWLAYLGRKYGDYSVTLRLMGDVKIKHIFLFFIVLDLLLLNTANSGGHIAHLASMLAGWLLAGKKRRIFSSEKKTGSSHHKIYDNLKTSSEKRLDKILDKINRSGFESLTAEEKEILYRESERNSRN